MNDTELKASACRYCINSMIDEVRCELMLCSMCVCVGDSLRCAVSGIFHDTLFLSLGTRIIIFPFYLIVNSCDLNSAVHKLSHSFTIDTS